MGAKFVFFSLSLFCPSDFSPSRARSVFSASTSSLNTLRSSTSCHIMPSFTPMSFFSASLSATAFVKALASFSNSTGSHCDCFGKTRRLIRSHASYIDWYRPMNSEVKESQPVSLTQSSTSAASKLISSI